MDREKKKKIYTAVILVLFLGSTLAFALSYGSSLLGQQEKKVELPHTYEYPLDASQEAAFIKQNFVIVKYFYNGTCATCDYVSQSLDKIFTDLNKKIIIEKIDTVVYSDEADSAGVTNVPYFYLKGSIVDKFEYKSSNDLFVRICNAYLQQIDECKFT